ncbi:MAG TPA: NAD-dependent epimerase/dehydratase family protein [Chthoniobacterales bacterium]|nr:NAD-dependent epimerase/dehydratase family protein [Chthoniobacterales bacterium]
MKIFISGICGFAGSSLALSLLEDSAVQITGCDNFSRAGSQTSVERLRQRGARVFHADVRLPCDLEQVEGIDWIIDAAAEPSVLAGVDGSVSSRRLVENNLNGTVNLLELAKKNGAGFVLLSTSRVYSLKALAAIPMVVKEKAFQPAPASDLPRGMSPRGVTEDFSTAAPISLYGSSKLASECLALEYGETFGFPVWINRCGVLAGAGQFGHAAQGIFSFWIHAWQQRAPLKYLGFDGGGHQTRDCLHPRDLVSVLKKQFATIDSTKPRIVNFAGGTENSMSLAQLSEWCAARFGPHEVGSEAAARAFDVPWLVLDCSLASRVWDWQPTTTLESILDGIARHAEANPSWLEMSAVL